MRLSRYLAGLSIYNRLILALGLVFADKCLIKFRVGFGFFGLLGVRQESARAVSAEDAALINEQLRITLGERSVTKAPGAMGFVPATAVPRHIPEKIMKVCRRSPRRGGDFENRVVHGFAHRDVLGRIQRLAGRNFLENCLVQNLHRA